MFRAPQSVPAPQPLRESSVHSASAFIPARSGRYLFSDPFNFKLSTFNLSSDAAFLPRIDAKLTRVNANPFLCHSYKKHRGWGMPRPVAPPPLCACLSSAHTQTPATLFLSRSYFILLCTPRGGGRSGQFDLAVRPAKTASGRPAAPAAESFFAAPAPAGVLSPALAPAVPVSIARRTKPIGASSFNMTVSPLASTPRCCHIAARSTCTGLSFHSAYDFSS